MIGDSLLPTRSASPAGRDPAAGASVRPLLAPWHIGRVWRLSPPLHPPTSYRQSGYGKDERWARMPARLFCVREAA